MATAMDNNLDISLINVLSVTIPATLVGVLAGCAWSLNRGKDLDKDEAFQARLLKMKSFRNNLVDPEVESTDQAHTDSIAKRGLALFLAGIFSVIVLGNVQ